MSQEPLHLRDLFTPLPLEALPLNLRPVFPDPLATAVPLDLPRSAPAGKTAARHAGLLPASVSARSLAKGTGARTHLAWLSTHLSTRQWDLLTLLFAHPLLNREELAAFLGLRVSSARLLLQPVARWGMIAAQPTEEGTRWHLTERGVRLLAAAHQIDVRNLTVPTDDDAPSLVQRGLPWLQQHVRHTAGLYSFFARLAEATDANQGLCWWETGAACERRYQRQDGWHNFRPDALAEYRVGTHAFRFWLEWDRGTMNERDLRRKFASYAFYLASCEWVKERTPLPRLLCVTPDVGPERRLAQVARAVVVSTNGLALYTTTARLFNALGPLASIWMQVLPLAPHEADGSPRRVLFAGDPS